MKYMKTIFYSHSNQTHPNIAFENSLFCFYYYWFLLLIFLYLFGKACFLTYSFLLVHPVQLIT